MKNILLQILKELKMIKKILQVIASNLEQDKNVNITNPSTKKNLKSHSSKPLNKREL